MPQRKPPPMFNTSRAFILLLAIALGSARAFADPKSDVPRPFDRDVATILAGRCFDCHNPADKKGGLDLTRKATTLAGGENGPVLVPGKPADSQLWKNVSADEMPPKHPLPAAEKETLRRWIA